MTALRRPTPMHLWLNPPEARVAVVSWVVPGFGMEAGISNTAKAVMSLSQPAEQGPNRSSLTSWTPLAQACLLAVRDPVRSA